MARLTDFEIHISRTRPFLVGRQDPTLTNATLCYKKVGSQVCVTAAQERLSQYVYGVGNASMLWHCVARQGMLVG